MAYQINQTYLESMVNESVTIVDLLDKHATYYQNLPKSEDISMLNQIDINGDTPLMLAITLGGRLTMINLLLKYYNDLTITNLKGQTAITMAKDNHLYWSTQLTNLKSSN